MGGSFQVPGFFSPWSGLLAGRHPQGGGLVKGIDMKTGNEIGLAVTGKCLGLMDLRDGFTGVWRGFALDAPDFLPIGSCIRFERWSGLRGVACVVDAAPRPGAFR